MAPEHDSRLLRARRLAHWLDDGLRVPGTTFRVGADPIFGLIPVVGDFLGAGLGAIIVLQAARLRVPLPTVLRMILNLLVDEVIGSVPLAGDLYDAMAKVNLRNVALLERALEAPGRAGRTDRWYLVAIFAALVALLAALAALSLWMLRWLIGWLVQ